MQIAHQIRARCALIQSQGLIVAVGSVRSVAVGGTGVSLGVGVAVGNAVRTSLVVVVSVTLLVSLSVYGSNGNFNLSG